MDIINIKLLKNGMRLYIHNSAFVFALLDEPFLIEHHIFLYFEEILGKANHFLTIPQFFLFFFNIKKLCTDSQTLST